MTPYNGSAGGLSIGMDYGNTPLIWGPRGFYLFSRDLRVASAKQFHELPLTKMYTEVHAFYIASNTFNTLGSTSTLQGSGEGMGRPSLNAAEMKTL